MAWASIHPSIHQLSLLSVEDGQGGVGSAAPSPRLHVHRFYETDTGSPHTSPLRSLIITSGISLLRSDSAPTLLQSTPSNKKSRKMKVKYTLLIDGVSVFIYGTLLLSVFLLLRPENSWGKDGEERRLGVVWSSRRRCIPTTLRLGISTCADPPLLSPRRLKRASYLAPTRFLSSFVLSPLLSSYLYPDPFMFANQTRPL